MMPSTEEAKTYFRDKLEMPEDCDGVSVENIMPLELLDKLPRHYIFGNTKIAPKKTHKHLFNT